MLSSADDMVRWHRALLGEDVLSAAAKEQYFGSHVPEQPEATSFYGYGWAKFTSPRGTLVIGHNGSIGDYFTADAKWYVDENVFYFVTGNAAEFTALQASREIRQLIFLDLP